MVSLVPRLSLSTQNFNVSPSALQGVQKSYVKIVWRDGEPSHKASALYTYLPLDVSIETGEELLEPRVHYLLTRLEIAHLWKEQCSSQGYLPTL